MALPGVIAVLTGADAIKDGLKPIPHRPIIGPPDIALGKRDASDKFLSPHRVLPHDKARFAGEAVAMVVADSRHRREGCRRTRARRFRAAAGGDRHAATAVAPGAPWFGTRRARTSASMPRSATPPRPRRAFERAAHVVKLETWVQRVTGVPLEPRAAVGHYDPATGRTTLYAGSGGVVRQKHELAGVLDVPLDARARRLRRRRRQFRHAQRVLSRIRAGRLGVAAHRPPGQMDVRAPRGVSQRLSGARSLRRTPNLRSTPTADFLALRGSNHQQCRRAHRLVRAADQGRRR